MFDASTGGNVPDDLLVGTGVLSFAGVALFVAMRLGGAGSAQPLPGSPCRQIRAVIPAVPLAAVAAQPI
jgi:hypothetical protein